MPVSGFYKEDNWSDETQQSLWKRFFLDFWPEIWHEGPGGIFKLYLIQCYDIHFTSFAHNSRFRALRGSGNMLPDLDDHDERSGNMLPDLGDHDDGSGNMLPDP